MLALALMILASHAQAAPRIQPPLNQKVCLAREYSNDHMRKNPRQLVSKLHLLLETKPDKYAPKKQTTYAKIVGQKESQGKIIRYGNEATCELKAGGIVHCYIECDGGSFDVLPRQGDRAAMQITKDYYFPLYRQGADPENPRDEDTLSLNDNDPDNRLFGVQVKDAGVCQREWNEYKQVPAFGC
jgi:hypothetical protein